MASAGPSRRLPLKAVRASNCQNRGGTKRRKAGFCNGLTLQGKRPGPGSAVDQSVELTTGKGITLRQFGDAARLGSVPVTRKRQETHGTAAKRGARGGKALERALVGWTDCRKVCGCCSPDTRRSRCTGERLSLGQ
ncbi:hypothetical protein D9M71_703700 [compost metagenome]